MSEGGVEGMVASSMMSCTALASVSVKEIDERERDRSGGMECVVEVYQRAYQRVYQRVC